MTNRESGIGRRAVLSSGILFGVGGVVGIGSVGAQVRDIEDCTTIDMPGEYRLSTDLSGTGPCLEITASDVTLDGNGQMISGSQGSAGIVIEGEDVSVSDVTVTGFETGITIAAPGVRDVHIENARIQENETGIRAEVGSRLSIETTEITKNTGTGLWYNLWEGVHILDSEISDNGGPAINAVEGWELTLEHSTVVNNAAGLTASPGDEIYRNLVVDNEGHGILVDPFPQPPFPERVRIEANDILDNDGPGIEIRLGEADIIGNTIVENTSGIVLDHRYQDGDEWIPGAHIADNEIHDSRELGVLNATARSVDASCNWWGAESGPVHPTNPVEDPQGETIEGEVTFVPWIRNENGVCAGGIAIFEIDASDVPDSVHSGEILELPIVTENTGHVAGSQLLTVSVDDEPIDAVQVTLEPGASSTVPFAYDVTEDPSTELTIDVATNDDEARRVVSVIEDEDDASFLDDDVVPGLGVISALAGLGGAGYVLRTFGDRE